MTCARQIWWKVGVDWRKAKVDGLPHQCNTASMHTPSLFVSLLSQSPVQPGHDKALVPAGSPHVVLVVEALVVELTVVVVMGTIVEWFHYRVR